VAGDFNERVARARAAGKGAEAVLLWRELLTVTNVEEEDYKRCCTSLVELYMQPATRRPAAAAAIKEYLRDLDGAFQLHAQAKSLRDMARLAALRGMNKDASDFYTRAGLPAHAAHQADLGGQHVQARSQWMQLVRPADVQGNLYVGALARFNAARSARNAGEETPSRSLFFEAMNLLGQEADRRETDGDRDGAFRCFMVMKDVGRAAGAFEDVAEGYLNCSRLLRAKGDRFGTIQALHELIRAAEEMGELHAASELYREAGDYARRMSFLYADHFLVTAGHSWKRVAAEAMAANRPLGMVENALLAAVDAFSRTLNHREVARCYQALAALDLVAVRKERYQRLAQDLSRLAGPADTDDDLVPALPEWFKRNFKPVDYAVKDLLERESGVELSVAASQLLAADSVWDVERRRALNLFLAFDDHVLARGGQGAALPLGIIHQLGDSHHAALVAPLVEAFKRGDTEHKCAAVVAASKMKLREAIVVMDLALGTDRNGEVYAAGLLGLRGLNFPGALESLMRMFGSHDDVRIKEVALKNVAMVGTGEAAEFLLDVVRSNSAGHGVEARKVLLAHVGEKMLGALENNKRGEPNREVSAFIGQLLSKARRTRDVVTL
jgi:hypothetical protein